MAPADIVGWCKMKSIILTTNGERLEVYGPRYRLTDRFMDRLRSQKGGLVEFLQGNPVWQEVITWPTADFERWDERAAILEFMDNLTREQAERIAWERYAPEVRRKMADSESKSE